jgi:hypothetical protein
VNVVRISVLIPVVVDKLDVAFASEPVRIVATELRPRNKEVVLVWK